MSKLIQMPFQCNCVPCCCIQQQLLTVLLLLQLSLLSFIVNGLPTGFIDEGIANMRSPNTAIFIPNPRRNGQPPMMIVAAKEGSIYAIEDPDDPNKSDIKIVMGSMNRILCTNGPRGVYSMVAHPNFNANTNPYVYVFYTRHVPNCPSDPILGPTNRLSRFTINPITLQFMVNSEVVLLETPPSAVLLHDGGGLVIHRNENHIYLAIGDGGVIPNGQDLQTLYGKLIRITLNGTVPNTNPYTTISGGKGVNCRNNRGRPPPTAPSDAVCEEIYSYGLRNPFRMRLDPNTLNNEVRFAIGDVGNTVWEEISYGGTNYKGTNYGFAIYEGICKTNSNTDCPIRHPIGYTEPFYYYQHIPIGGAVTGVVFVPNTVNWPDKYQFMFVDYVEGKILNLLPNTTVGCRSCIPPRPNYQNETFHRYNRVVDVFFGPYKNNTQQVMYYVTRDVGRNIRRIRYIGGTNRAPIAIIQLSKKQFTFNEVISLIGSNSTDPDGDTLSYRWTFGDGRTSTAINPTISYTKLGTYTIELVVSDTSGLTSRAMDTIVVGTPPTVNFESPIVGQQFSVDDIVRLRGRGRDSSGVAIPPTQLFWEVHLRHATHFHPFMTRRSGNDFNLFPAPPPEDYMAATNSYLHVILTAVDSNNLSTTIRRDVFPKKVLIDFDTIPSGLIVVISDFNVQTPATITAWQNQNLKISTYTQSSFQFASWNIGGTRERFYLVPPVNTTKPKIVAQFVPI